MFCTCQNYFSRNSFGLSPYQFSYNFFYCNDERPHRLTSFNELNSLVQHILLLAIIGFFIKENPILFPIPTTRIAYDFPYFSFQCIYQLNTYSFVTDYSIYVGSSRHIIFWRQFIARHHSVNTHVVRKGH